MTVQRDQHRTEFQAEAAGKPGRATGAWDRDGERQGPTSAPQSDSETGPAGNPTDHEWAMSTGLMRRYNG